MHLFVIALLIASVSAFRHGGNVLHEEGKWEFVSQGVQRTVYGQPHLKPKCKPTTDIDSQCKTNKLCIPLGFRYGESVYKVYHDESERTFDWIFYDWDRWCRFDPIKKTLFCDGAGCLTDEEALAIEPVECGWINDGICHQKTPPPKPLQTPPKKMHPGLQPTEMRPGIETTEIKTKATTAETTEIKTKATMAEVIEERRRANKPPKEEASDLMHKLDTGSVAYAHGPAGVEVEPE